MAVSFSAFAQEAKEYPKQEPMRPGMSEYWTPQPAIVTPGDKATSSAPSDAIILFDGKDLSAWESARDGSPANWNVHDGIVTVNKRAVNAPSRSCHSSASHEFYANRRLEHLEQQGLQTPTS